MKTLTSLLENEKVIKITKTDKHTLNIAEKGFTLIEILVALLLVTIIMVVVIDSTGGVTDRGKLDEGINKIERAVRFSVDESALRNVITRVHFKLSDEPQIITVEYGPDANFVIPSSLLDSSIVESLAESEAKEEQSKELNKKFSKVKELEEDEVLELPDGVKIIGVGTDLGNILYTEGEASLYFYPSGEKDRAVIILSNDIEFGIVQTETFQNTIDISYEKIKSNRSIEEDDYFDDLINRAKEIFETWLKE